MSSLSRKIAVITGGTSGIGLATAQRFAAEGATVVVTGRNPETLAHARDVLGDTADVLRSDAGDAGDVAQLFEHVQERYGRIDILFLNAGIARFGALEELPLEDVDAMLRVNLRGPWLALRAASPLLSRGASVILNTSAVNVKGMAGATIYAATKAGLRSLARSATAELAPRGIRVNAVSPGPIETPIYGKLGFPQEALDGFAEGIVQQVPQGRFGRPEEVAEAALFLAGEGSSFISGTELAVDGGMAQV